MASCSDLSKNEFHRKKILSFARSRDVNKDGVVTRGDTELVISRFRENGASERHMRTVENFFSQYSNDIGLTDSSKSFTYEQLANIFYTSSKALKWGSNSVQQFFKLNFKVVDVDQDGKISYKEWENYYLALGIDPRHASASFTAMNRSQGGSVSLDEFMSYHREFFYSTEDRLNSSILYGPLDQ